MRLVDYQEKVGKIVGVPVTLYINDSEVKDNEEHILSTIIKTKWRVVHPYMSKIDITFRKHNPPQDFLRCTITEFPNCCGKLILHTIKASKYIMKREENGLISEIGLESVSYAKILEVLLDLVKESAKIMMYSSISFIVSRTEQLPISESMQLLGYKPVNTFSNQRMLSKNVCDDYVINLEF